MRRVLPVERPWANRARGCRAASEGVGQRGYRIGDLRASTENLFPFSDLLGLSVESHRSRNSAPLFRSLKLRQDPRVARVRLTAGRRHIRSTRKSPNKRGSPRAREQHSLQAPQPASRGSTTKTEREPTCTDPSRALISRT